MPNWAESVVTITGDLDTLEKLLAKASENGEVFSFNNLVPLPEHLEETHHSSNPQNNTEFMEALTGNRKAVYTDWYNWRVANWGTKWDTEAPQVHNFVNKEDKFEVTVTYLTAWSPATNFWQTVSEAYPVSIYQRYWESGMAFIGETTIENGEVNDYQETLTKEHYQQAGAKLDSNKEIDWESDYDLCLLFPLVK